MKVLKAYSFLVHPAKHLEEAPKIGGTEISLTHEVGVLLSSAFIRAENDCSLEISFDMASDGTQKNEIRDLVTDLLDKTSIIKARKLAQALQAVTTNRSGLGLLFVLTGQSDDSKVKKIYLCRFPADNGIVAEENEEELQVEFLKQVFMKSAFAYKAVIYQGRNTKSEFWDGRAVDKQVSNKHLSISGYWIRDFLRSDFKTTAELGTKRLAQALRDTIAATPDLDVKSELTALATLAKNFNNKIISIKTLSKTLNLSDRASEALLSTLQRKDLAFTKFKFSSTEFSKHIKFKQIQLSNGAVLAAPPGKFNDVFEKEVRKGAKSGEVSFTTTGKIVDESLRKSKP